MLYLEYDYSIVITLLKINARVGPKMVFVVISKKNVNLFLMSSLCFGFL